jgi:hypothetical protein
MSRAQALHFLAAGIVDGLTASAERNIEVAETFAPSADSHQGRGRDSREQRDRACHP